MLEAEIHIQFYLYSIFLVFQNTKQRTNFPLFYLLELEKYASSDYVDQKITFPWPLVTLNTHMHIHYRSMTVFLEKKSNPEYIILPGSEINDRLG